MTYLWVALGGALGSVTRFALSGLAARWAGGTFPVGTLLVNVSGSLLIGMAAGLTTTGVGRLASTPDARAFVMVGLLGGFTTFSAFSLETLRLTRDGDWLAAGANVALSLVMCLAAVWLGFVGGAAVAR